MKKQQFKFSMQSVVLPLIVILAGMATAEMKAQAITITTVKGTVVPSDKNLIYVELRGGDGGKTDYTAGGQGAMIRGVLKIGTGANEIAPGGVLRIIPGKAGKSTTHFGGGGGGGTALAYQATANAAWVVLAVAGGGGGAGCTQYHDSFTDKNYWGGSAHGDGKPGSTGNAGAGNAGNSPGGYGGGGAIYGTQKGCGGKRGLVDGVPVLADGGSGSGSVSDCYSVGGAGFGSGGAVGVLIDFNYYLYTMLGGGGGGYSGGDGARNDYGGEGGSSYINDDYFLTASASSNSFSNILHANDHTDSPQDGYITYQYDLPLIEFVSNGNKCLDDDGGSITAGANIQTYDCIGKPRQQWFLNPDDLSLRLVKNIDKCIDLDGNNAVDHTNVQLSNCDQTYEQQWLYNGLDKTIRMARYPQKCLDATTGLYTPKQNVNVQINHCGYEYAPQYWNIEGATTVSDPTKVKYIVPGMAKNLAVHSQTDNKIGSNIQLWSKVDGNDAETWYFDGLRIKLRTHQNLCIDLKSSNTSNGNNIQLWTCKDTDAQRWIYNGLTHTIHSAIDPFKCMEVGGSNFEKGGNIQISDCNTSVRQKFLIIE